MSEELKNELIYLASFSMIKKLYESGEISKEIFERLNNLNAKTMNCKPVAV